MKTNYIWLFYLVVAILPTQLKAQINIKDQMERERQYYLETQQSLEEWFGQKDETNEFNEDSKDSPDPNNTNDDSSYNDETNIDNEYDNDTILSESDEIIETFTDASTDSSVHDDNWLTIIFAFIFVAFCCGYIIKKSKDNKAELLRQKEKKELIAQKKKERKAEALRKEEEQKRKEIEEQKRKDHENDLKSQISNILLENFINIKDNDSLNRFTKDTSLLIHHNISEYDKILQYTREIGEEMLMERGKLEKECEIELRQQLEIEVRKDVIEKLITEEYSKF